MPALEITADELVPARLDAPPRLGASVADWAAYRARRPKKLALPAPRKAVVKIVWETRKATVRPKVTWTAPEPASGDNDFYTPRAMSIKAIISEVALDHKMSIEKMLACGRTADVVAARHEAMYRLRIERRLSLPQIGRALGGFDHSTILHGIRTYCDFTGSDFPIGMSRSLSPIRRTARGRFVSGASKSAVMGSNSAKETL